MPNRIPENMKAAVLVGPNDLRITEVEIPHPKEDEILIKVSACAICGSDISLINKPWPSQPPFGEFIPGHEYAGTIVGLGKHVDEFKIGDRVAVEAHKGCGRCINCRRGLYTTCLNYGNRYKGHRANGFTSNGGYAEYVVNHVSTVYKVPDNISFDEACLVTTAGCPLYGIESAGSFIAGETVLVIGPGPIGLMAVQIAKALGAGSVILTGTRDSRLKVGKRLGADKVINIKKQDPVKEIEKFSDWKWVNLSIECSGQEDGIKLAFKVVQKAGKIILLGFPHHSISVDFDSIVRNNIHIYGVRGEGMANCSRALSLMAEKKINARSLITHTFPLTDVQKALNVFSKRLGGAIKVILKP